MGNATSRSAACNSSTPSNMEAQTPSQMSFPRSPGVHDLAAFNPQQNPHGAKEVTVTSFAGDELESGITHPKPARPLIRRYSELLDPTQLDNQQVRSPSGHMLTGSTYNLRGDRPLSIRERQERINHYTSQKKKETDMVGGNEHKRDSAKISVKSASKKRSASKNRRACLGCFGV
jgi:hypothetical protein